MLQLDHRPRERWVYLSNPQRQNTRLAIFVHGFIGNYLTTWGRLPSLLEEKAENETPFDAWDYVFLGYATRTITSYLDVADLLRTNIENAFNGHGGFVRQYGTLALFGHSLGTLGIRQLLCAWDLHTPDFLPHIHSVTFFGTPLNGSPLAVLRPVLPWWPILDGLRRDCPQLRMLSTWTKSAHPHKAWPLVKVIVGLGDQVVGSARDFVNWPGDKVPYTVTTFDHTDMKKPDAWTSSSVIDEIRQALKDDMYGTS